MSTLNKFKAFVVSIVVIVSSCNTSTKTYTPADAHSHNDYKNSVPFYRAYNAGFGSIEADVFAVNGRLMVAHDEEDITPLRSLKLMYIAPLIEKLKKDTARKLRLLIEIKKDYTITLPLVMTELYPLIQYFDSPGHTGPLSIVITGAVPPGPVMLDYPAWLNFDVDHINGFTPQQLAKIALVSVPFSRYSKWDGKGALPQTDAGRLTGIIDSAHALGKKIRFFAIPDTSTCWKELIKLHADVIGTDHINELADFLNKKEY